MSGFRDPIIGGGGALVYPSIHSPDFSAGVSGWSENKDGSAEFNNLTIRGAFEGTNWVINSSGIFQYSGSPALGNLILAIAPQAGTDAFGNVYGKMLNAGTWQPTGAMGQHFGVDPSGRVFLADSAGTSQVVLSGVDGFEVFCHPLRFGFANTPGVNPTPEAWHPLPLAAGWSVVGAATPSYRLNVVGNVELLGRISNPAAANNQLIATLPAGYFSAVNNYSAPCAVLAGAAAPIAGQSFRVALPNTGQLGFSGVATTGSYTIALDGVMFPLSFG